MCLTIGTAGDNEVSVCETDVDYVADGVLLDYDEVTDADADEVADADADADNAVIANEDDVGKRLSERVQNFVAG